ncbi:MAG: hypothetical protein KF784_02625 [Fimbriimonadaceae bacterium]|nr:hypothetical protein [Fimbriimonadaceae bacterium]
MRKFALLCVLAPAALFAQGNDEAYGKKIREYTTEPFFLTELVDHLPASSTVPSPMKHFGDIIGAPNVLHYTTEIHGYMRALEKASPRVKVVSMGKSEEGREMICVVVSSEANLKRLDRLKEINTKLGDPRTISDADAQRLIKEGVPFYYATAGLHSPESGPPEMVMELAYRLAVSEEPNIQRIRNNSVVMITPVMEPDGRDRFVDTYLYRKKNPDKPRIPLMYWGKYVAHDNNRDAMCSTLALSQNLMKTWFEFRPQVMHDLHESVSYLYISTGTGPYNAWLDPMTIDQWHQMAYHEVGEMTRRGVPGVWTHGFYDGWSPGYAFYAANGHNAIGRFYETQGGSGADTSIVSTGSTANRDWFRPNPPYERVQWSIRNNTNLMQSALLLGLDNVATNKEKYLFEYWLKSKRSVAKARTEGPAAWVLPGGELRKGQQSLLLEALVRQGIEIHRLDASVKVGEQEFPAGSYVVRMDQPYSRMGDMLLDRQYYSTSDPRPYDDTGWTLGPLFNVQTVRVKDVSILDAKMSLASSFRDGRITDLAGEGTGKENWFIFDARGDVSGAQLRYALKDSEAVVAEKEFTYGGKKFAAGTMLIRSGDNARIPGLVKQLNLSGYHITADLKSLNVPTHALDAPRIAYVHTWQSTQDEGWGRIALDQLGIPYAYVSVHTLRDLADLRSKFDVIILGEARGNAQSIVNGVPMTGDPIPWKALPGFTNLGGPDQTDDIRGGIELSGMVNLQKFVNGGGLIICLGNTCRVPIDYGLVSGVSVAIPDQLIAPGGVYRTENDSRGNPALYGYDEKVPVFFRGNLLLEIGGGGSGGRRGSGSSGRASGRGGLDDPDVIQGRPPHTARPLSEDQRTPNFGGAGLTPARALLRFSAVDSLLISGALEHGEELEGKAAVAIQPVGKGNIMLFAASPFWRGITTGSWSMVFNSAMNYKSLQQPPRAQAGGE